MFGSGTSAFGVGATPFISGPVEGPPYSVYTEVENGVTLRFNSISAMPAYRGRSFEELRLEDYARGRKGKQPFGSPAQTTTPFGQPQTSTFGQPASGFGQPSSPFGATAITGGFGGFGQQQQPVSTSTFGQQQPSSTFGQQQASTAAAGGLFGKSAASPSAFGQTSGFGAFGQTSQQPTVAFGQATQQSATPFGQPTTGSLFGQASQPTGSASATGFGQSAMFGQQQRTAFGQPSTSFGAQAQSAATPSSIFGASQPSGTTTTSFGAPTTAGFTFPALGSTQSAAQPSTGFKFGTQAPSTLFGTQPHTGTSAPAMQSSLFGGAQAAPSTGLFGTTTQPSTTSSLFGSAPAQPSTSLFGATQPTGSLFGGTQTMQPSLFGTQSSSLFVGSKPATDLFGAAQQQQQATAQPSLFGTITSAPSTGSLFSAPPTIGSFQAKPSSLPLIQPPAGLTSLSPPTPTALATSSVPKKPSAIAAKSPAKLPPLTFQTFTCPPLAALPTMPASQTHFVPRRTLSAATGSVRRLIIESHATAAEGRDQVSPQMAPSPKVLSTKTSPSTVPDTREMEEQSIYGDFYTIPSEATLRRWSPSQLESVPNFVVGQRGVGQIRFLKPVDLTDVDLDELFVRYIQFEPNRVTIYPEDLFSSEDSDDTAGGKKKHKKPAIGKGFNVPAQIRLERCWPLSRSSRESITDPSSPRFVQHVERLREVPETRFIDFITETGTWAFEVDHF